MKTSSLRKALILCLLLSMLLSLALPASAEEAQLQIHHVSLLDLGAHMEIPDRDLTDAAAHVLQAISAFEESINVYPYGMTLEEATYCANNIYYSHPELFQLGGAEYSFTMYLLGDTVTQIVPSYAYTKEEAPAAEAMILEEIDRICALVDPTWNDLEIALFLHDYLCVNFQYDNTYTNHNMYFFLRDRTGVCSSYYATYRYLLSRFHITSDYAISDPMNHIWTMLKLDDQWYHVDVTWDDPVADRLGRAAHSCFLRSDAGISTDANGNTSHRDWVLGPLVSQAQSISSAYEGWFWNTVDTAFVPQGDSWYYIDDAKGICAVELTDAPAPTLSHSIPDHWFVLNDPALANYYWPGIHSGLSAHGSELIYNTPTAVKGYTPETGATRTIYQLTDPTVNIYGSALQSGTLSIQLADNPNTAGTVQSLPSIHDWLDATCTEPKTCDVCHATEGEPIGHIWLDATCTEPKTCDVCDTTDGDPIGHIWLDATCTEPKTCDVCDATEGEPNGHTWLDATCTEPKTCDVCGTTAGEPIGHTWLDATCTEPKTCDVCGTTVGEPNGHIWLDATCTEPKTCDVCHTTEGNPIGHIWLDATCTEPKTCDVCGTTEGEPIGHTWLDATCTEPKTCDVCHTTEGEPNGHTWLDATCTEPKTCDVCGTTVGEPNGHIWLDATCTEPKTCDVCGTTVGEPNGHIWLDATCTEPKTCDVCGTTVGEPIGHTWLDATCTEPKTCDVCHTTEGDPIGHIWLDATCTEPKTCDVCDTTEGEPIGHIWLDATCTEPKTCDVCHTTEGDPIDHIWLDATCTEPKTCDVCDSTVGDPIGHIWLDATCTELKTCDVCGTTEGEPSGHIWLDATCTEPKTCDVCGTTEGDPIGHEWDQGTVTQEPTHTAPGKLTHTCQRDPSHTYEVEIPQLDTPEFPTVTLTLTGDASVETTAKSVSYVLSADHMTDLVSMTVTLNLDETYLTDPQVTGLNDWIVLAVQQENGALTISLVHDPGAAGQAEILRLTAAITGKTGVTAVSITEAALTANAQFSVEADLSAASTTTEVIFNVYDMNQDGEISLLDVTRAQRFYGMDHPQADLNGDHTVDITDLVILLFRVLETKNFI